MEGTPVRRKTFRAGVVATVGACAASLFLVAAPTAAAQDGPKAHFVVLGPEHGSLHRTEAWVRLAGGEGVKRWPQIGVVIATSTSADFAATVRHRPGVVAAGASRNLAELDQAAAAAARSAT